MAVVMVEKQRAGCVIHSNVASNYNIDERSSV